MVRDREITVTRAAGSRPAGIARGISFELVHAAKHVHEVPHLAEEEVTWAPDGHSGDVLRG